MKKIGLYIHIPFCKSKCPYCDFFSVKFSEDKADEYTNAIINNIKQHKNYSADTIYFGGGTPGILGTDRLLNILDVAQSTFPYPDPEITIEINPESSESLDFKALKNSGVNRISIGVQSTSVEELKYLGRLHTLKHVESSVKNIQDRGITNISLDLMLGISHQTINSLNKSIEYCADLNVTHISAYILKIEENTPYYTHRNKFVFPNEDLQADLYLFAVNRLNELGFKQYEISNFCKDGFESKHNLKYWNCEEYLGIGPSSHSFLNGERFYYNRSFNDFYNGVVIKDGIGGDKEEYCMLKLRLTSGLNNKEYLNRFGENIPQRYFDNAYRLKGLVTTDEESIRLTQEGFLLSNSVISKIIF